MGKLQHIQHQIIAINDLIKVNNDRIAGYEKTLNGEQEYKYSDIFGQNVLEGKKNVAELIELIQTFGGQPANGTTFSNKISQRWSDIRSWIRKPDNKSILRNRIHIEKVVNAAYRKALDDKELIWDDKKVILVLSGHLTGLKTSLDKMEVLYTGELSL